MIRAAVLTVSDRCSRAEREDLSGPALRSILTSRLSARIAAFEIVPDDPEAIASQLIAWSHPDQKIDLILTTGGTGLAPRDNTPEAAKRVIEREHPGLLELARRRCYDKTPKTYLSRGISSIFGAGVNAAWRSCDKRRCEECRGHNGELFHSAHSVEHIVGHTWRQ